jgi:hypothetical protein
LNQLPQAEIPWQWVLATQICVVATCFLPVLWLVGVLPPVDALFVWAVEQAQVVLFGATPTFTSSR